ncbi:MAG: hypothetical protein E7J41_10230 [Clostridium sp.]|nr:hypothetical protein [Clostridium sp.]MDU7952469.1 hypothetical protein [Clostridium sp.]
MGNKFVMVGGGSTQSPGILEVLRKRAFYMILMKKEFLCLDNIRKCIIRN